MAIAPAALQARHPSPADDPCLSDEELIEQLRAGDDAAFRVLVARHRPWLVRLGTRLLGNDRHAAEDLAQETLLKLHAAARRDQRPLRVRPWLAVVARNASRDEHRKRRPELPGELPEAPTSDAIFMVDPALSRAWSVLGGRHREVLYLRELLGLSYREIATVMGLSDSALETLLFRARAALRREYERAGGTRFGCGVLGLGLFRFARDDRRGGAGTHVDGCDACGRAVDALRGLGPLPDAPVPASSAAPAGRCARLPDPAPGVDLVRVPPSLWTSLSSGEPFLAKVFSAGAAMAAAAIPAVLSGVLTTMPPRPATGPVVSAPAGVPPAAPLPAAPPMAVAPGVAVSRPAGAPVTSLLAAAAAPAGMPPGQEQGELAAAGPFPDRAGEAAAGDDRLGDHRLDAGVLGSAPTPRQSLAPALGSRRQLRDDLRSAGGLAPRVLEPQPVSDRPARTRPAALVSGLRPEALVPEPAVTVPAGGDGPGAENFEPATDVRVLVTYRPGGIDRFFAEAGEVAARREVPPAPTAPPDVARLAGIGARHGLIIQLPPEA